MLKVRQLKCLRRTFYSVLIITVVIYLYTTRISDLYVQSAISSRQTSTCEPTIHMGTTIFGYNSTFNLYISLKSIYLKRNTSLHFHILCDKISKNSVEIIFQKWDVSQVSVQYYNYDTISSAKHAQFILPQIIQPTTANKIIIFKAGFLFNYNVLDLWSLFNRFPNNQVIGWFNSQDQTKLMNQLEQKSFEVDLILCNIQNTTNWKWIKVIKNLVLSNSSESMLKSRLSPTEHDFPLIYNISCSDLTHTCYNTTKNSSFDKTTNHQIVQYNGGLLKKTPNKCYSAEESPVINTKKNPSTKCSSLTKAQKFAWRILPFIRTFKPDISGNITFVSQFTYDRINMLKDICRRWKGPMSLTLYVSDSELHKVLKFIENTKTLTNRSNIAYHVVFKETYQHPINLCRNVAWKHVLTPYVFLSDVDFLPMKDLDTVLQNYITEMINITGKALVVPAFQTVGRVNYRYPENKIEAVSMFKKGRIKPFKYFAPDQHGSTNYGLWKTSTKPYKIRWRMNYEPYVVVTSDTMKYDERFVGYGRNKVAHILHLHALGYEFIGLPNTFTIHRNHPPSGEANSFKWKSYKRCIYQEMLTFIQELERMCQCKIDLK